MLWPIHHLKLECGGSQIPITGVGCTPGVRARAAAPAANASDESATCTHVIGFQVGALRPVQRDTTARKFRSAAILKCSISESSATCGRFPTVLDKLASRYLTCHGRGWYVAVLIRFFPLWPNRPPALGRGAASKGADLNPTTEDPCFESASLRSAFWHPSLSRA